MLEENDELRAAPLELDMAIGSDGLTRDEIVSVAVAAEHAGLKNFWVTEGTGRDAFSVLTSVALATQRIGLGTGIVNIFARTPTATAQAAASLMELMGDRTFNLGLGASGKALIEKFHGIPFEHPMARMQEFIQIVDQIFKTGKVPAEGTVFKTQDVKTGVRADRSRLKIFVAGLTPRTIQITGEYADGWLPIWPSKSRGMEALATLRSAAEGAGREMPTVAAYIYGVVSDDPKLVQLVRGTLAWYLAANGVAYRNMFNRMGYEREANEICDLWTEGKRDEARQIVNQEMLEDTSLFGDVQQFEQSVQEFRAAGIDRPILRFPEGTPMQDILNMLGKLNQSA